MRNDVFDVLSDDALLERMEELTRQERHITFNVLLHLGEVERRRIYLREGYASMFDYCTRGLGYSESAAYRRIKTYRCMDSYPDVVGLVQQGTLTITTIAMIAGVMNGDNCADLLHAASGQSQREVQKIVAGYKTGKPFRDRIKAVVVERPAMSLAMAARKTVDAQHVSSVSHGGARTGQLGQMNLRHEGKNAPEPACGVAQPERETYYEFTIAADEEFMQMYRRVRCIQSTRANPGEDIAATFKALMHEYIARHAPEEKQARRKSRKQAKARNESTCATPDPDAARTTPDGNHGTPEPGAHTRHIPAPVKDKVRVRDQYQCTYVGGNGVRCKATRHLQFDHIVPFSKGGAHEPENLRLLCAAHNRLEAAGVFGVVASHAGAG